MAGASLLRLQSDERLADLAADGHEAAFNAIVDRYRMPLTRYCAGIVGPSRAEDVVQQALINAHHALQRTDEVRHLRSWLYRIAHNAALNVLRAVRDDVPLDAASDAAAVAEDGPVAAFERSERFRETLDALRELPERQRAALVLRELEGRSHEEIAETLGVTSGAARQHLMRARVALRGAVTAITPYPLVVRLAEMLASPGVAGWTDVAVGTGAGATLAKLTAGVAATGALVGGTVGTERVVNHDRGQDTAQRSSDNSATKPRKAEARAVSLPAAALPVSGSRRAARGPSGTGDRKAKSTHKPKRDVRGHTPRGDQGGSGGRDAGASSPDAATVAPAVATDPKATAAPLPPAAATTDGGSDNSGDRRGHGARKTKDSAGGKRDDSVNGDRDERRWPKRHGAGKSDGSSASSGGGPGATATPTTEPTPSIGSEAGPVAGSKGKPDGKGHSKKDDAGPSKGSSPSKQPGSD